MMNITTEPETPKDASAITPFLVTIGKKLLKDGDHTDWLDIPSLADLCRKHKLKLNGTCPTQTELDNLLPQYFSKLEELYEDGVNVIGYQRRIGWDLVWAVRFYSYDPAQYRFKVNDKNKIQLAA